MDKALKAQRKHRNTPASPRAYRCANCPGEITVVDNADGELISVNIDGHAKPAHRACPDTP